MQTARVLGTTRSEGGVQAMGAKVVGALRGLLQKGPEAASMRAKHEHRRQRKRRRTADKQEQQKQQDAERAQTAQRQTFSGSGDTMMRRAKKKKKKQKDQIVAAAGEQAQDRAQAGARREAAAQQQADGVTFTKRCKCVLKLTSLSKPIFLRPHSIIRRVPATSSPAEEFDLGTRWLVRASSWATTHKPYVPSSMPSSSRRRMSRRRDWTVT